MTDSVSDIPFPASPFAAPSAQSAFAADTCESVRGEWQSVTGRDVAALLDPRPTLIVGAVGRRNEIGLATIIWATPISHEPSMVAFSLRARSHTMSCIQMNGCFSLNVLPADKEGIYICEQCGTRTGFQFNKNTLVQHHIVEVEWDKTETIEVKVPRKGLFKRSKTEEAEKTTHEKWRVPVVNAATSWMACCVDRIEEVGDHLLVIGYVIEAHTCAPRNDKGLLIPQDVLQCVQHGCYGKIELLPEL